MMPAQLCFEAFERREALGQVLRVAAGHGVVDRCGAEVMLCFTPPAPPDQKSSRHLGEATRSGGWIHRFSLYRKTVATFWVVIPWIFGVLVGASLGFTKRRAAFATFTNPRVCFFFPRFHAFSTRLFFAWLRAFFFFFFFFKREIERREGADKEKGQSTGWVLNPWIENLQLVEKMGFPRLFRGCGIYKKTNVFNGLRDLRSQSTGFGGGFPPPPCQERCFDGSD